ncbi:MAG: DUF2065 domain-containing protein [Bdellovibrionales bacterium]|jgi:uncharacterized protein YjeT (DUF2065 family)|nr:DUF2065 domain-containing protein [Bdellovibrionales bacterium]
MMDILTALGLMLVIEGAMYAGFPRGMREMIGKIAALSDAQIRNLGLFCAVFGFLIIAVLRGF